MTGFNWERTPDGDKFFMVDAPSCWILIKDMEIVEKSACVIELEVEKEYPVSESMLQAYTVLINEDPWPHGRNEMTDPDMEK